MDDQFATLYESVLRNPPMYTLTGTFGEVIAFLEGYHSEQVKEMIYPDRGRDWRTFERWLSKQLGVEVGQSARTLWRKHGDSQAALADLVEWVLKFKQFRMANAADLEV